MAVLPHAGFVVSTDLQFYNIDERNIHYVPFKNEQECIIRLKTRGKADNF